MRAVERVMGGLFVRNRPRRPLTKHQGTIDDVTGNGHGRYLTISSSDCGQTGFSVPREQIDYVLKLLGLQSTRQLRTVPVTLYSEGPILYGISGKR